MTAFTLAHLGDVHLGPIAGFFPRYWNTKRLVGYANWSRRRRMLYRREVLDRIVADVLAQAPDHIALTGDLVNLGLPGELSNALAWLQGLGDPGRVTVVPGNHDIYTHIGSDAGTRRWAAYMTPNSDGARYVGEQWQFPFVRRFGRLALIGVNSAVPTPPIVSWGRVGWPQLASLEAALGRLRAEAVFRVVLIHHPPLPGQASRARGLQDASALTAALERHGAELIVHGHNHQNMTAWLPCASGITPVIGAPGVSLARPHKGEPMARYNLYRIEWDNPPRITLIGRGLAEPDGPVVELERRQLSPGEAAR
jgi:3',5'-cyclic AMP phosphodiesterase CpdA